MALVTLGGGVAAASGSLGGMVFSRNRGGAYVRNRSVPVNPNTTYQQTVRSAMATLASRWVETLTEAQRIAWDTYALNVPLTNPLGVPRNVGGIGMYQRSNVGRVAAGISIVDVAPTIFDLGQYTAPSIASATASTDIVSFAFENTDDWANEDGANMFVYIGRPQNPSVNFFKGPYRLAALIAGDAITPPTSPVAIGSPFPFEVGQQVFLRVRVSRVDGRLSSSFRDVELSV